MENLWWFFKTFSVSTEYHIFQGYAKTTGAKPNTPQQADAALNLQRSWLRGI
jgi:hypothetical protein